LEPISPTMFQLCFDYDFTTICNYVLIMIYLCFYYDPKTIKYT